MKKVNRYIRFYLILFLTLGVSHASWCFSPYSNRELDQLEKEFVEQINQSPLILRDPLVNAYINHLGQRLAKEGQLAAPDFFIVSSNEINAFAGPGGHIGINTQLILVSDTESELAAVMAHEMSHVRLHHLYRMLEHEKQMQIPKLASMLAAIALGVINPALGSGALMATLGGFAQDDINFVRSNEKEADRIGIDMLAKSGLDPRGMAAFFKKMQQSTRYYYSANNVPSILRTHPLDDERIAEAENRSNQMTIRPVTNSIDYMLAKELVRTSVASDYKALLEYYQRGLSVHPNDIAYQYGYALTLMQTNRLDAAEKQLQTLLSAHPESLFFNITLARAQNANQHAEQAITRLRILHDNYPNDYAVLYTYADSLNAAGHFSEAANVLLKGTRQYPRNLTLCTALARAEADNHQKDYAYFTEAQCASLQGQRKEARRLLKLAQKLNHRDVFLKARIEAKLDELAEE